ncbi:MAG: ferrous iron transport protein B [Clostridiaceae bacterium]|nr:ferrous iron transport protein B [Clostridiaceae bacterium]
MSTIALAGNPNSGKTTLFNRLTGTRQTTGNWPGVTVEKKVGMIKYHGDILTLVDLPGIYSLSPYSLEEIVTRNFILDEKPDVVINIIDVTNLERNLYLTLQLKKLGRPLIVALNMMDEIVSHGDKLDTDKLEELLGVPVIAISAKKNEGMDNLLEAVITMAKDHSSNLPDYDPDGHHGHHHGQPGPHGPQDGHGRHSGHGRHNRHEHQLEQSAVDDRTLITDSDSADEKSNELDLQPLKPHIPTHEHVHRHPDGVVHAHPHPIGHHLSVSANHYPEETDEQTADLYRQASAIHDQVLIHSHPPHAMTRSDKIDRVLTGKWLAIPIFLLIMLLVFQITFSENIGGRLTELLDVFFQDIIGGAVNSWLAAAQAPVWISSLLVDGIIAGVGGVLTFLPQISLLFIFLTLLEDTGYMARAAFIVDRIFQKLGLSGRSFIPMLMGFGCTVPAVMAARTLENERERRLTILITPFMSCGARMPIYAFFASLFFASNKGLVTFSMYFIGILIAIISAVIISAFSRGKGHTEAAFMIELPPYRLPDGKSLFLHVWDKVKDFLVRAGTLIFAMTIVVWFLQSFDMRLRVVADNSESIFGVIGSVIAPLLRPLGFGNWQSAVALLTGLVAKESVVATIGILFTEQQLLTMFTPLSAYAFMTFTLLYTPCLAALGAIKREMNSWKWTGFAVLWQTGMAWSVSFLIYQVGKIMGLG